MSELSSADDKVISEQPYGLSAVVGCHPNRILADLNIQTMPYLV